MAQDPKGFWEINVVNVVAWISGFAVGIAAWMRVKIGQETMSEKIKELQDSEKEAAKTRESNGKALVRIEDALENYHQRIRKLESVAETNVRIEAQTKRIYEVLTNGSKFTKR